MAGDGSSLACAVDCDGHCVAAVDSGEMNTELALERRCHLGGETPFEQGDASRVRDADRGGGSGPVIAVAGDAARLEHDQKINPVKMISDLSIEDVGLDGVETAVGVVLERHVGDPEFARGGSQLRRPDGRQIDRRTKGARFTVREAQDVHLAASAMSAPSRRRV